MRPSLELLRSQMNACLTCRGQLYTPGSGSVLNEDTGKLESGPPTVHYDGRMLVYPQDRSSDVEAGAAQWHLTRYVVTLPAGTPVALGHRLKITTSPDAPDLLPLAFVIVDAPVDAWVVARQCVAETVT